ncbi:unannotated protein [freshwater metagenome]|uniref:Unannotated protein n=1 Tax=freshwater metagenome TaxID=449393 RepID=A0A6J7N7C1_9ZZZZ
MTVNFNILVAAVHSDVLQTLISAVPAATPVTVTFAPAPEDEAGTEAISGAELTKKMVPGPAATMFLAESSPLMV